MKGFRSQLQATIAYTRERAYLRTSPSRRRTTSSYPAYRTSGSGHPLYIQLGQLPVSDVRAKCTVAAAHATLHHDDLLTFPCVQDGHPRDRAARLEGNRVDSVVRANDQCHVCVAEIVVYLVHLKHNCGTDFFPQMLCTETTVEGKEPYYRRALMLPRAGRYTGLACVLLRGESQTLRSHPLPVTGL